MHERQLNSRNCCVEATLASARRGVPAFIGFVALAICGGTSAAIAREAIGVYRGWVAFRDDSPRRCYALAAPVPLRRGASIAVGYWPDRRAGGQVALRVARPMRPGSAILLAVDGRPFQLVGRGARAWAPGRAADRAIVGAMRTGVEMVVTARDTDGVLMEDRYRLTGAASAVDAAALACRPLVE